MLGISSFSYGWAVGADAAEETAPRLDAFDLLRRAGDLGVPLVQFGDNLPLDQLDEDRLQRLSRESERLGIRLEVGTRGFTRENILRYAHIALICRSSIVRIVTDLENFRPAAQEITEIARTVVPVLEEMNVTLAVENHDRLLSGEIAEIVREVDSGAFGVCLDLVNSMGAGEGIACAAANLAPHTVSLHVKDFTVRRLWHQMGFIIEGCPAGAGMLNIPGVIQEIHAAGRRPDAVLELWTPPEDSMADTLKKEEDWVCQSLRYLRTLPDLW